MKRKTINLAVALMLVAVLTGGTYAATGDNIGTGDVGGDGNALIDSPVFNLTSTGNQLSLFKRAFMADGTPIASGSTLPQGTTVKFMIYVSNDSSVQINDVSVQDVLDTSAGAFTYTADSIQVDNSVANCAAAVCTVAEEQAIYAAVNANTATCGASAAACTDDDTDSDLASWDGTDTIDIGNSSNAANAQLDIAGNKVFAVLFSVTMN
jgi:uncharacterized repeat protein (TIGR01451 family)